ncbi:hypothetical protein [uncultured Bacteroides sp.]|uniref:hypothetical protein n=1 Tax=uncultured Bacteroides sp. TaxID=162156 RepID=UPI0027DB39D1|nr:hypothetical protein [uncultured Bacteroides sp.]
MNTNITPIILNIRFILNGKSYSFDKTFGPLSITERPDVMSDAVQSAIEQYMSVNKLNGTYSNVQVTTVG